MAIRLPKNGGHDESGHDDAKGHHKPSRRARVEVRREEASTDDGEVDDVVEGEIVDNGDRGSRHRYTKYEVGVEAEVHQHDEEADARHDVGRRRRIRNWVAGAALAATALVGGGLALRGSGGDSNTPAPTAPATPATPSGAETAVSPEQPQRITGKVHFEFDADNQPIEAKTTVTKGSTSLEFKLGEISRNGEYFNVPLILEQNGATYIAVVEVSPIGNPVIETDFTAVKQ